MLGRWATLLGTKFIDMNPNPTYQVLVCRYFGAGNFTLPCGVSAIEAFSAFQSDENITARQPQV
jgi:hypothetical protein